MNIKSDRKINEGEWDWKKYQIKKLYQVKKNNNQRNRDKVCQSRKLKDDQLKTSPILEINWNKTNRNNKRRD